MSQKEIQEIEQQKVKEEFENKLNDLNSLYLSLSDELEQIRKDISKYENSIAKRVKDRDFYFKNIYNHVSKEEIEYNNQLIKQEQGQLRELLKQKDLIESAIQENNFRINYAKNNKFMLSKEESNKKFIEKARTLE